MPEVMNETMNETMNRQRYNTDEALRHSEGPMTRKIEEQTAKLPSDMFLWAALGSMGVSLSLHAAGRRESGLFVGQWAAPFLLFGIYNKIVKTAGSDRTSHGRDGMH